MDLMNNIEDPKVTLVSQIPILRLGNRLRRLLACAEDFVGGEGDSIDISNAVPGGVNGVRRRLAINRWRIDWPKGTVDSGGNERDVQFVEHGRYGKCK